MPIRSPIIVVVGHVDHGKSTLLDKIRETTIQKSEAGGITQCIGATEIPTDKIKEICGDLLKKMNINIEIPGVLAIDTPGHEAFTNLRKRGGSVADLAILVIDITQGVQPQTKESIEILMDFKVPFIIAANKIDLIPGWNPQKTLSYMESIKKQNTRVKEYIQKKVYDLMGELGKYDINCELFNKINNFTESVAIVPCSGLTGEGVSELLMMISGLTQKFLKKNLKVTMGRAKGSVLEVKDSIGMGKTIDVVVYDGVLKKNQFIITIGTGNKPIITRIRALLKPKPLQEIRDKKCSFVQTDNVIAASGIKIAAPQLDQALAGMPIQSADDMKEAEKLASQMKIEVQKSFIEKEDDGIVLKADSIGSLEALTGFLKRHNIKISNSGIGPINKSDAMKSIHMKDKNLYNGIILGFNVKTNQEAKRLARENSIQIMESNIIYRLLEGYNEWKTRIMENLKREKLKEITLPGKFQIMGDFIFRKSNPAVIGVHVLQGSLKPGVKVMKETGEVIGIIKQLQDQGVTIQTAVTNSKIACSIKDATYDKDFINNEILYTHIPEKDFIKIKRGLKSFLKKSEINLIKEIIGIERKNNPLWGLG